MKIAFCHHLSMSYNAGGEQEIAQVAVELAERGHDVKVYALPLTLHGRRLTEPDRLLRGIPYREAWRHKVECDVAYVTYHPLCLTSFRTTSPKIAGFHSQVWFQKPTLSYGSIPLLAKLAYDILGRPELGLFDAIHVHDDYLKKTLAFTGKPIFSIPHPIDLDTFRPAVSKNKDFTVLFCGRPEWAKGFDDFLNLARGMQNQGIQFTWLGGDDHYANVTSLGFSVDPQKVAEIMGKAHVVVMPQRVDSVGRSTLEALAVGTPVLLRANPRTVPQQPSLILVQTEDEFKDRILEFKRLWEDGGYAGLSLAAERVSKEFSVKAVVDRYEEMFRSLA